MTEPTAIIRMKRVVYGKPDTPKEKREYSLGVGHPVGFASEIAKAFADLKVVEEIQLLNHDNSLDQKIIYKEDRTYDIV